MNEKEFEILQDKILDAFYVSGAVNDTIWFDAWTTLYEELMMILARELNVGDIDGRSR